MNLAQAHTGKEYIIKDINTTDEELITFLFTLGCYSGQPVTVVSHVGGGCIITLKDGRYSIDKPLAEAIEI